MNRSAIVLSLVRATIVLTSLGVGGMLVVQNLAGPSEVASSVADADSSLWTGPDTTMHHRELVATYIGSPDCPACTSSDFHRALRDALERLSEEGTSRGYVVRRIGVAATGDARRGFEFLLGYGEWDEVSTGGGWMNSALATHLWGVGRQPVTPQLLLSTRTVWRSPSGDLLFEDDGPGIALKGIEGVRDFSPRVWDALGVSVPNGPN